MQTKCAKSRIRFLIFFKKWHPSPSPTTCCDPWLSRFWWRPSCLTYAPVAPKLKNLAPPMIVDKCTLIGRTARRTDEWPPDGRTHERTDGRTDWLTDGRTDGRTDSPTDGPTDVWMDVTNERADKRTTDWRLDCNCSLHTLKAAANEQQATEQCVQL